MIQVDVKGDKIKPREKVLRFGVGSLSNSELLAIILGRGVKNKNVFSMSEEIAEYLQKRVKMPEISDLTRFEGVGQSRAMQVLACLELSARFLLPGQETDPVTAPAILASRLAFLKKEQKENFVCATLSSSHQVINIHTISVGLLNRSLVHPREAFCPAMEDRAAAVIFAHNHPSGSLRVSREDITTTRRLMDSGTLLGIPVLDHLIISHSGWISLKAEGYMDESGNN